MKRVLAEALILLLFFVMPTGCGEKAAKQENTGQPGKIEGKSISNKLKGTGAPRDEFHGFVRGGGSSPGDPDYHKGTFLSEKVGLKKDAKKTPRHPTTPDEVIKHYSDILINNPDDAPAWVMVGNGYSLKGMYDDAISKYKKALSIKPLPDAYSNMGFAYHDKGEYDEAISNHEKALEIDPKFSNSYYGLALAYEKKGEVKRAIANLKGYVKIAKKDSIWVKVAKKKIETLEKQ